MRGLMMAGALALMAGGAEAAIYRYDFTSPVLTSATEGAPVGFAITASIVIDVNAFPERLRTIRVIPEDEFLVNSFEPADTLGPDNYVFRDASISFVNPLDPTGALGTITEPSEISIALNFDAQGKGIVTGGNFNYVFTGPFGFEFVQIGSDYTAQLAGMFSYTAGGWDWTRTYLGPTPPALVPLPAGLPLLGLGLVAMLAAGRAKKFARQRA